MVGSKANVAQRVLQAAKLYEVDVIVRITADCPLVDPDIIDEAIDVLLNGGYDLVASRLDPLAYPDGMDVDVFTTKSFRYAWNMVKYMGKFYVLEHIVQPLVDHPLINKCGLRAPTYDSYGFKNIKLSIDTEHDYNFVRNIVNYFTTNGKDFRFPDILQFINNPPFRVSDGRRQDNYLHTVGVNPPFDEDE